MRLLDESPIAGCAPSWPWGSPTPGSAKSTSQFGRSLREPRDPKSHFAKARAGALHGFTGTGNDYQLPVGCEPTIDNSTRPIPDTTDEIERKLLRTGILFDEPVDLAAIFRGFPRPLWGLLIDLALWLKGPQKLPLASFLLCSSLKTACNRRFRRESPS